MYKVVESPRSKKKKTRNGKEQEVKGKKTQLPAWNVNEAKEQAIMRRMDGREKEKERCKSKEKAIMAVDRSDEYEYIRVEGVIDSGSFDTIIKKYVLYFSGWYFSFWRKKRLYGRCLGDPWLAVCSFSGFEQNQKC